MSSAITDIIDNTNKDIIRVLQIPAVSVRRNDNENWNSSQKLNPIHTTKINCSSRHQTA